MDASTIAGSTTTVDSDIGGKDQHFALSGHEHGVDKVGADTQSPYSACVGEENDVAPSAELPGGSVIYIKCGGSPLHRRGETVNRTDCSMSREEALRANVSRQKLRTVQYSAPHRLQQMDMIPEKDAWKAEEGQVCSKSETKSSSNLVNK